MTALPEIQAAFLQDIYAHSQHSAVYLRTPADAARLSIYANNTRLALRGFLAARYQVVQQVLGAGLFGVLSDRFIAGQPLTAGSAFSYGAGFASLITTAPELADVPYVAELAVLEWALHQAEVADDAEAVAPEALLTVDCRLHPAATFLELQYNTVDLWQAHQGAAFSGFTLVSRCSFWVTGRTAQYAVFCQPITASTRVLMASLQAEESLAEALSAAAETAPFPDVQRALAFLLTHNLIVRKENL